MKATFTALTVQHEQTEMTIKTVTIYTGFACTFGPDTYLQIVGSGIPGSAPLLKPEVKHTLDKRTYVRADFYTAKIASNHSSPLNSNKKNREL